VRVKDSNNVWSLYEGGKFYLHDTLTVSALPPSYPLETSEFFFDADSGVGNGDTLNVFAFADSIQFTDTIATAPLTAGTHYLYVRVRDTMNTWSLAERKAFVVCNFVPVADFSADTVCLGNISTFTDLSSNQDTSFNYTYSWDFDNNGITDDTTRGNTSHQYFTSGTHTVALVVNNTNGCSDTTWKTIYIDSLPNATFSLPVDTICHDDTLTLTGGSPAGGVYSGSGVYAGLLYCDSISAGLHTVSYTYYNSDSCSVTVTDKIYVSPCTGIHEYVLAGYSVNISPNPFNSSATLNIQSNENTIHNLNFMLYDVFGKVIREFKLESSSTKLDRENIPAGIYFYKIADQKGNYLNGKVVVAD
jgi:hypothetical protein